MGLIVKSNHVVEAGYELSTSEQRLILSAIEQIPKGETIESNVIYEVSADSLIRLFGVHPKTAYRDLKEAASKLYDRSIIIKTKENTLKVRWLQMLQVQNPYFEDVISDTHWKSVLIVFSQPVIPFLSDLKANFTKYFASDLKGVSSAYTIRFYELIKQYESIGKREISIKDLRFMLCLEDKYPLFADLKRWVIDTSINELNKKTPMQVSYELRKTGRRYTHIMLKFTDKKKRLAPNNTSKPNIETSSQISESIVKRPKNTNLSNLEHRASKITSSIISNRLSDRFKQADESILDMMKRIQCEIISDEIADAWQNKLEEFGVVF